MFLKWMAWLFIFSFGSLIFSFSSLSFATSYSRGSLTCKNFENMEELYKAKPENISLKTGYARCLIAKGDDEGLTRLYLIDEQQGNVVAAYYIAQYVHTDGTFEHVTNDRVDEAIEAYFRILALIDLEPHYPVPDYIIYEINMQMELTATYAVPALYYDKFLKGAYGIEQYYILQSPDYKGDRDLKTYPEYNRYTVDSLNKMIKFANYCINLPSKGHFDLALYTAYKKACQVLKDTATALLPMEIERLTFLENQTSCRDLSNCPEYDELTEPMGAIMKQSLSDQNDILRHSPHNVKNDS